MTQPIELPYTTSNMVTIQQRIDETQESIDKATKDIAKYKSAISELKLGEVTRTLLDDLHHAGKLLHKDTISAQYKVRRRYIDLLGTRSVRTDPNGGVFFSDLACPLEELELEDTYYEHLVTYMTLLRDLERTLITLSVDIGQESIKLDLGKKR